MSRLWKARLRHVGGEAGADLTLTKDCWQHENRRLRGEVGGSGREVGSREEGGCFALCQGEGEVTETRSESTDHLLRPTKFQARNPSVLSRFLQWGSNDLLFFPKRQPVNMPTTYLYRC